MMFAKPRYYKLHGRRALPCSDMLSWAKWFETADRRVAEDHPAEDCSVSTVFLGLDHNFDPTNPSPVLYETMVFGGPMDGHCERYRTWKQAEEGHATVLHRVVLSIQKAIAESDALLSRM